MCIKNCYFLEATTRSSSLFCCRGLILVSFVCELEDRKWVLENRARRHLFYYGLLSRMRVSAPHPPSVEQCYYTKMVRVCQNRS